MSEDKEKEYRTLRPWQGFLVIVIAAVYLFLIAPKFIGQFGRIGSLLGEAGFLLLSVTAVWIWKGDFKVVFPFRKPCFTTMAGVGILWMGMMLLISVTTMLLQLFFPEALLYRYILFISFFLAHTTIVSAIKTYYLSALAKNPFQTILGLSLIHI